MVKKMDIIENLSEIEILALTIYGESRGEPIQGQIAVGCVIRNRTEKRKKTYKEICLAPLQFSCWNTNDPNRVILLEIGEKLVVGQIVKNANFNQALWVAQGVYNDFLFDNTKGSDHYLTTKLRSEVGEHHWARKLNVTMIIGNHTFMA